MKKATRAAYGEALVELAEQYPEYHFEQHKGYGTKQHYEGLKNIGSCEIHRRTFIKTIDTAWK